MLAKIEKRFGEAVAEMVRSCSDGLNEAGNRSGSWIERKVRYVEDLPHMTADAALVTAADKIHNARCIAADVRAYGQDFWSVFTPCRHQIAWYYGAVRAGLARQLDESTIQPVLNDAVERLVAAAGLDAPPSRPASDECGCRVRREKA